jgi:quercetin dioxygenase-like cupin family protein
VKLQLLDDLPWEEVSHNPAIKKRVFLRKGELPGLTQFAQARFGPGECAPSHAHADMVEVFFVSSGTLTAIIDGRPHTLPAGSSLTVEVGEAHELRNDGNEELILTYFGLRA